MPRPGSAAFAATLLADDPSRRPDLYRRIFSWLAVDLVLDVGGHRGSFRDFVRDEVGYAGPVTSFEPDPDSYDLLRRRAVDDPGWTVVRTALGAGTGSVTLHRYDRSNLNSVHAAVERFDESFEVTALDPATVAITTLAAYLEQVASRARSIFVKVDTQGHDLQVLTGAAAVMDRISGLQLELSLQPLYEAVPHWTEAIAAVEAFGLRAAGLFPVTRDPGLLALAEVDGVFVRDTAPPPA